MSMGSRDRIQEGCTRSNRLQSVPYESNRGQSRAKVPNGQVRKGIHS